MGVSGLAELTVFAEAAAVGRSLARRRKLGTTYRPAHQAVRSAGLQPGDHFTAIFEPSLSVSGGDITTRSPFCSPARISTRSPSPAPVLTARRSTVSPRTTKATDCPPSVLIEAFGASMT